MARRQMTRRDKISNVLTACFCVMVIAMLSLNIYLPWKARQSVPVWLTDAANLREQIKFFASIEKAQWIVVTDRDNNGLRMPAPSSYTTIGFARVDEATMERLALISGAPSENMSYSDLI